MLILILYPLWYILYDTGPWTWCTHASSGAPIKSPEFGTWSDLALGPSPKFRTFYPHAWIYDAANLSLKDEQTRQILGVEYKHLGFIFISIKEKCVESFPSHLQFSLQSETDFPEIPSEFRISWNCLSLSDHTTLMWRSCIHPEISDVSDFSWIKCLWNLVLKYGPFPTVNENYEVWAFQFSELSSDCIPQTT